MGFFDNAYQYFDSPDISSGYSGMDSGGGSYWDDFGSDFNYDVASSGDSGSFWDDTPDAWSATYDDIFSSNALMPEGYETSLFDPQPEDESIGDKLLNFAGSKNGLSLIGGALLGGMQMYNRNQDKKTAQGNRAALASEKERERQFQKELEESKAKHAMERLKAQLEASGGGGHDRPAPGTATNTNTAIGAHKVRW